MLEGKLYESVTMHTISADDKSASKILESVVVNNLNATNIGGNMGNKVAGIKPQQFIAVNATRAKSVSIVHNDVGIKNGVVCITIKNDNGFEYRPIANFMSVKAIVDNIDTGYMNAILEYHDGHDLKEKYISYDDISSRRNILSLAKYGVDVNDNNANNIIKHLRNEIGLAKKQHTHITLGFGMYEGEQVFKHTKLVKKDKEDDVPSEYSGGIIINKKGSPEVWRDLIDNDILGVPPLELALAIGFSAPIVGFIINEIGIECPLIHIYGDSTQGKSTAAMVAVSAFGSPNVLEDGLLRTWNATFNAIQGTVIGNTGVPIAFDESSMSSNENFTKFIYTLASGKGKKRADVTGRIQEQDSNDQKVWQTTLISTGEHSLLSKSNENPGLRMRLYEFGSIPWTNSASHSEKIKETLLANYGHYGSLSARVLLKLGKDKVIAMQKQCRDELAAKLSGRTTDPRVAGKLSLILVAAKIVKRWLKIDFNIDSISQLLVNSVLEQSIEGDLGERAYNKIMQLVAKNEKKFNKTGSCIDKLSSKSSDSVNWGVLEYKGRHISKIVIMEDEFKRQIKELGFEEAKTVLQALKKNGLLDCEKGKYYRKRSIDNNNNDSKIHCYVIKVKPEYATSINMQSDTNEVDLEEM